MNLTLLQVAAVRVAVSPSPCRIKKTALHGEIGSEQLNDVCLIQGHIREIVVLIAIEPRGALLLNVSNVKKRIERVTSGK